MTVRGFLISDDFEGTDLPDSTLRIYECDFKRLNSHRDCETCRGGGWAHRAFVWPRNGFSEFPLDFDPVLARVVQSV